MKNNILLRWYTTLGFIGYLPASGSLATGITVSYLYFFPFTSGMLYLVALALVYISAYWCIKESYTLAQHADPSEIVIDEVIGTLVTFYAVPISPFSLVCGFCLFRLFDISKIGPVGWSEKINGPAGILLDDIVAGVLSNCILRGILYVL